MQISTVNEKSTSRMTRKDEIFEILNHEALTVLELVERFGLTRGAIALHLKELEAAGLIKRSLRQHSGNAGKPPSEYRACAGFEDRKSLAYPIIAPTMIEAIGQSLDEDARTMLYSEIGKKLASHVDVTNLNSLGERVKAATDVADSLGAATHTDDAEDCIIVRSYTCPIASMVRQDGACCVIIQEYFAYATGHTCVQECHLGDRVVCQYRIFKN